MNDQQTETSSEQTENPMPIALGRFTIGKALSAAWKNVKGAKWPIFAVLFCMAGTTIIIEILVFMVGALFFGLMGYLDPVLLKSIGHHGGTLLQHVVSGTAPLWFWPILICGFAGLYFVVALLMSPFVAGLLRVILTKVKTGKVSAGDGFYYLENFKARRSTLWKIIVISFISALPKELILNLLQTGYLHGTGLSSQCGQPSANLFLGYSTLFCAFLHYRYGQKHYDSH